MINPFTMNSKRRILVALSREVPDKVPILEKIYDDVVRIKLAHLLGLSVPEADEALGYLGLLCGLTRELKLDEIEVIPLMGREALSELHIRDKYGCVFRLSKVGQPVLVDGPIKGTGDIRGYDMASRLHDDDFAPIHYVVEELGGDKAVEVCISDPFKISWQLRGGMQNLLMDYILEPDAVHALARITTDFNLAVLEKATEIGADLIFMDGDISDERGSIMSPSHYREYVKPYQQELVNLAHAHDLRIVKHSDGNMWPLLQDHIDIGFDGFHPIQPDVMDIGDVKEKLGDRLCLVGNIDCRALLCSGTEKQVEEAVRRTIEIAAPGGGFILSSSNSIHPGVIPENYIAMVRAAHRYGACHADLSS